VSGCFYVLRTQVPASQLDAPGVVTAHKNLKCAERDFRHIKADDRPAWTRAMMGASSFSVAASSSSRVRARSAARTGLRQAGQPLAGVVGAADLGQVLLTGKGQLQRPVVGHELSDRGRAAR
jgi:hypothetical protein